MATPIGWRSAMAPLCAALWACGGGGGGKPGELVLARVAIGPEGGTVAVATGDLAGLRLEVPPGAVASSTTFTISEVPAPDLSPLPPGLAAFNPTVRVGASPAFSGRVRLAFPMNGIPAGAGMVAGAFLYDEGSAAWGVVLPRALGAQEVTIETGRLGYWRWGFSLLRDTPADALARGIAEWLGQTLYAAFQAQLQQSYDEIVAGQILEEEPWTNCQKLYALGSSIGAVSDGLGEDLRSLLAQQCGGCDLSVNDFMNELGSYVQLKMRELLVNGIVDGMNSICRVNDLLGLVMQLTTGAAFAALRGQLHCDFDCLFDDPPPGLIGDLAAYYLTAVALVIVDYAYFEDQCSLSSGGAPAVVASPGR